MLDSLKERAAELLKKWPARQSYIDYWLNGYSRDELKSFAAQEEATVDYLSNSRNKMVILKLMDFPILRSLWLYHPTGLRWVSLAAIACFPIGLPLWLAGRSAQSRLRNELTAIMKAAKEIDELINKELTTTIK